MALSELEAHQQAMAARAADEALRASARTQAGPNAVQVADDVFRAPEGGPAYQVTGGAVVTLNATHADALIADRSKGAVALELELGAQAHTDQAARLRAIKPLVAAPLAARLEAEAAALDGMVASQASLIADLGGVPADAVATARSVR